MTTDCASSAACAACDGSCGTCPYASHITGIEPFERPTEGHPCGHERVTAGCGGCDPGAMESVYDETTRTWRPFDAARDLAAHADLIEAVGDVLHEYWRFCNPAPFTNERALAERLSSIVGVPIREAP